jgi:hypothetical protein
MGIKEASWTSLRLNNHDRTLMLKLSVLCFVGPLVADIQLTVEEE